MPEKFRIDVHYIDQADQGAYTLTGYRVRELIDGNWVRIGTFPTRNGAQQAIETRVDGNTVYTYDENGAYLGPDTEGPQDIPIEYPPKEVTIIGTVFTKNVGGPPDD